MSTTITDEHSPVFQTGQPHEALHTDWFNPEGKFDGNAPLKRIGQIVGDYRQRLVDIHGVRVNRNPADAPAVHDRKLRTLVTDASRGWADTFQEAKSGLVTERKRVSAELDRQANLKVNSDYRNAVVGVFSGLKPEERMAHIEQAIAEGDGPTIATLLEAPSLVVGLTPELKEVIRSRVHERANATEYALLKQLDKAIVASERASLAAISDAQALLQQTDRFDKKTAEAAALEAKARAGFATTH